MKDKPRTQAERSAATRDALIAGARPLFAARGYADVGTEEIVHAAGVTRGALYHHFADKTELFAAVFEAVEIEVTSRVDAMVSAVGERPPPELMRYGARAWLEACAEPEVQRIVLLDAPAVLGWERWREICLRHVLGLVRQLLELAITTGHLKAQPTLPLSLVLIGALDEAALYIARADDRTQARVEVEVVLDQLLAGVLIEPGA
jgi:AcrR family transcriptional regulator